MHVTRADPSDHRIERHFCEACAELLGLCEESGDSQFLFPWEEQGPGSFSFTGQIAEIGPKTIVLRVLRCSHYAPGAEFAIPVALVPKGMRRVGSPFSFNFPADKISAIIVGRD